MKFTALCLILLCLTSGSSAQSNAKAVLFTDPRLDVERCTRLFNNILNLPNFTELKSQQISPIFLPSLSIPPTSVDLSNQYKIIQNTSILVEIGPDYFYGPSYFPEQSETNVENAIRLRITAFDLTEDTQNKVLEAAVKHLAQNFDVVNIAYVYDDKEKKIHPFGRTDNLGFIKDMVGKFYVHYLSAYDALADILGQILIEESNIIVLNVHQEAALQILRRGITLSGQQFNVDDTNFFAIEFSTNGNLKNFSELASLSMPITPQDLVFRDTAVKALVEVQSQLKQKVSDPTYITSSFDQNSNQTWIFYSYMYTTRDIQSAYKISVNKTLQIEASFQDLKPPPSRESLLQMMKKKGLRLGAIVVPPLIIEETSENGTKHLRGSEIALAQELMRRLDVSYEITAYKEDLDIENDGKWTGVFGNLQTWRCNTGLDAVPPTFRPIKEATESAINALIRVIVRFDFSQLIRYLIKDMDVLVGPFSSIQERLKSFRCTTPYRSFSYKFVLHPPFLKASVTIFEFILAFDVYTWVMIFVAALAIAASLTVVHKISPNILSYGIHPSMIFVFGYLFQGVRTRPPNRASSQIVIVVWWFFCLVLVIAFCANYAAYRSYKALETLPNSLTTLQHQEYYKYSYIKGSSLEKLMSTPLDPSIYALYTMINTNFDDVIPDTRDEGIDQVIRGGFALLDESPMIDYYAKKHCLTTSEPLWYGTYVFYMPKLLPYFDIINEEIIKMKADGTINRILKQSQTEQFSNLSQVCATAFKYQAIEAMRNPLVNWSQYSIEFAAAFGIFIICLGGLLIVLVVLIVEYCLGVYQKNPEEHNN